jgi:hypothetical protein
MHSFRRREATNLGLDHELPPSLLSSLSLLLGTMAEDKEHPEVNDDYTSQVAELHALDKLPDEKKPRDPESATPPSSGDFPEGGWRAWGCVAGSYVSVPLAPLKTVLRPS